MGKGLFPIQLLFKLHITSILRTCHARNLGKAYSIQLFQLRNRAIRSCKQKKWWDKLGEERRKDIEVERDN
jgi:hypothetical protein